MIGESAQVPDGVDRVTGRIGYVINHEPPGTLHLALVRSTVPHARIRSVDTAAARRHPDVVLVLTGEDLRNAKMRPRFGPVYRDQPVLAMDRVRYVGEPVAVVAATDARVARAMAAEIDVKYDELPAVFTPQEALAGDAVILHDEPDERGPSFADIILQGRAGNVCNVFTLRRGEGLDGFRHADRVFEHEFVTPAVQHVSMEPHAAVAVFEANRLTVTTCTQTPYAVRDALAYMFDLPASRVRVVVPPVGGGFGGKTYPKVEPIAAMVAKYTGRPAKIVLSREEEFVTNSKHQSVIRLRTAVTSDGLLVARQVDALFNAGAYTDISPRLIKNGGYGSIGPYRIPHVHVDSRAVFTNLPSSGAFRGYGVAQGAWAYESQMDIIAAELGIDPLELRRRNLLREGDQFATGEVLHDVRFRAVFDDATSLFDVDGAPPEHPHVKRGRGCAVIIKSTITPSASNATMKVNGDGSVHLLTSTVDIGQGSHTALAQIAADALGVRESEVQVVGPDTDVTPYDLTTSSSRSTAAMGAAVRDAAADLLRQIVGHAAEQLHADPGDIEVVAGVVRRRGTAEERSIGQVVSASKLGTISATGSFVTKGGLDAKTGQGIASEHWHQGAVAAEVDVDTRTGKVRVNRLRACVYAGTVVNPVNARMQMYGSVMFGISQALFEQIIYDDGHVANPNLSEYALAGRVDMPVDLQISLLEGADAGVVHGLGETALPPVAPAIANAIADAIGIRCLRLPMTAERIIDLAGGQ
ncbi:xanthine dehydrogenase family protein molybdopterin-binding subunit [Dactylosporangium sp. CA-092794]|uniref:xanthine dehydrogenase family protein molybdopterin-binding subunit n=1 Tax=Dactylosporangium sp. CA-092794 TaxID=3239929 RepID=UPI003D938FE5